MDKRIDTGIHFVWTCCECRTVHEVPAGPYKRKCGRCENTLEVLPAPPAEAPKPAAVPVVPKPAVKPALNVGGRKR